MSRVRWGAAGLVAVLVMVLAACAGMPTSGSVNAGLPAGQVEGPDFAYRPDPPQVGATKEQIVDGFIRAASGTTNNWAIAQLYLAPSFRGQWKPSAGVTIDVLADRKMSSPADDTVDVSVTPAATVDENGAYAVGDEVATTLGYTLAQQDDGEWRITSAPDGILLDEDLFKSVYNAYALQYFDATWQYLVPDTRWFPTTNAATWITRALVDGAKSPWLADSVRSAFPTAPLLMQPSVPVDAGVAQVEFTSAALSLDQTTLGRMQAQLKASLSSANITAVQISAAGTPLEAPDVSIRSTRVNTQALGLTPLGFGFVSGSDLDPVEGLTDAMLQVVPAPVAITMSADRTFAAVRVASDGGVWRVSSNRTVVPVDTRPGLVDPSLDPEGFIWSVPAASPSQLTVRAADGDPRAVADAWPGASAVSAMEVSRDGSRIVAAVTAGGRSKLWVAGIVRDTAGVPERLGETVLLANLDSPAVDVSWLDDATVGVLDRDGADLALLQQPVGGPGTRFTTPDGTASIAGGSLASGVRLRDSAGVVYVRRGSSWQSTATGVTVLATQTGSPASTAVQ